MSPSAEWEADYTPTERDYAVASDLEDATGSWWTEAGRRIVARIIGIAIARAIEAEIAPAEAV